MSKFNLSKLRNSLRNFFDNIFVEISIGILIFISCVTIVWELLLPPNSPLETRIALLNDLITLIFIIELSLRFWTYDDKMEFWRVYLLDVIAVFPLFRWFRIGRLLRLFRLVRVFRAFRLLQILAKRFSLLAWVFFKGYGDYLALITITIILVVTSSLLYHWYIGTGHESFLDSFWYAVFSLIAGEPVPEVPNDLKGRLVMLFINFSGMTLFALFVGIVTTIFSIGLRKAIEAMESEALLSLKNHVVICGYSRLLPIIIYQLQSSRELGSKTIVVVADRDTIDLQEDRYDIDISKVVFIRDDFTKASALKRAKIGEASVCIILSDKGKDGTLSDQDRDARTVLTALTIEKINPKVHTFIEILDYSNIEHLELEGIVDDIFIHDEFIGYAIASSVANKGLMSFISDVLSLRTPAKISKVDLPSEYLGSTFEEALVRMKKERNVIILAVERELDGKIEHISNPPLDYTFRGDEKIIVLETTTKS